MLPPEGVSQHLPLSVVVALVLQHGDDDWLELLAIPVGALLRGRMVHQRFMRRLRNAYYRADGYGDDGGD